MLKGTTIVAVKGEQGGAVAGDGQVTMGQATIMKHGARKVKRLYNDKVIVGFAGSVADSFTLSEKLEGKLEEYSGNLQRAAVELAKEWRTDKVLRKLEAMLIAMDKDNLLIISGTGYYKKVIFVHRDRKSTRLNSSHVRISYAVFCLKKKKQSYVML